MIILSTFFTVLARCTFITVLY